MTDARLLTSFPRHLKTRKLYRRLGAEGVWGLLKLWLYAAENRTTGDLEEMTADDIEEAADWPGEPGALLAALLEVRFVEVAEGGGLTLHDWEEHQPWLVGTKSRSTVARANASKKWGSVEAHDAQLERGRVAAATRSERLSAARAQATHTPLEWAALLAFCGPGCLKCGAVGPKIVKDHVVPIYMNGSDGVENLQPLCASCNAKKGRDCTDHRPTGWREAVADACKTPAERLQNAENACSSPFLSLPEAIEATDIGTNALGMPSSDALAAATLAGRACRMMREVGCGGTNPSHPDLVAALAEGITPATLAATAAEAIDAGKLKPFAYAIATARSRHAAGPKTIARGADHAAPGNHSRGPRSAADRVADNVRRARAEDDFDDRTFDQTGAPVARDDR